MTVLPMLVFAVSSGITTLDPFRPSGIQTYQVLGQVLEPLARMNPRTKDLVPCLARSWEINRKANSFRVRLRPKVEFHDGSPFTADDVKFTFDAYFNPAYRGEAWTGLWSEIKSIKVVDPLTVEFQAKDLKYLAFETVLTTLRILPRNFYGTPDGAKFRDRLVGTGPFKVSRFEPGRSLVLSPNARWWAGSPPPFEVTAKTVTDLRAGEQMLRTGELDVLPLPSVAEAGRFVPDSDRYILFSSDFGRGAGIWIDLNLRRPIFADRRVRHALVLLWDRERLNRSLYGGRFHLAHDGFAAGMPHYPPGKPVPFDAKEARRELELAGWRDRNADAVLEKEIDGVATPLAFTVLVRSMESERWVTLYQADAARAGVRVKIRRIEEDTQLLQMLKEGKFDAVAGEGGTADTAHSVSWATGGVFNFSGYSNPETDALIARLERQFDPPERRSLERELISQIRRDIPQVPGLFSPHESFLVSKRLTLDARTPLQAWTWRLNN